MSPVGVGLELPRFLYRSLNMSRGGGTPDAGKRLLAVAAGLEPAKESGRLVSESSTNPPDAPAAR